MHVLPLKPSALVQNIQSMGYSEGCVWAHHHEIYYNKARIETN